MKKIYGELAKIQQGLKAPKNLYNKFGNYYYRNAEGILEAVKPLLGGLALVINDEPVVIGERFYIKATAMLTDGEEYVSAVAYAREDEAKKGMDGCQITGACSSYARKYALNALLMIDDSKDSDDDSLSPRNPENSKPQAAAVTAGATVPPKAQNAPQAAAQPVQAVPETAASYLKRAMAEMRNEFVDTFNFANCRKALIEGGVIQDIPSATMTLDQAKTMVDAIYANFGDMRRAG